MVEHVTPETRVVPYGFTVHDWLAWEGVGDMRVELIDGAYVVHPAPAPRHQRVVHRLLAAPDDALSAAGLSAEASGGGVVSDEMDPLQGLIPDIIVVPDTLDIDDLNVLQARDVVLAVEVMSPCSRHVDRVRKFKLYASMGIPHYWIVDPEPPVTITTHVLVDGAYRTVDSADGQNALVVEEPFHVRITPADLATKRDA